MKTKIKYMPRPPIIQYATASDGMPGVVCPRCNRVTTGWPLHRADVCSPKDWGECIRQPGVIIANAEVSREL